jgi:arsenite methyltransferase
VLLLAARHLPDGHAVGLDRWRAIDQSGNNATTARSNAQLEAVADRVDLVTADMTAMPFPNASFDVVVSALAIHNIAGPSGRHATIDEALRVLRPGGRLLIADFKSTKQYQTWIGAQLPHVSVRRLGRRYWYGGPWAATRLVGVGGHCARALSTKGRRWNGTSGGSVLAAAQRRSVWVLPRHSLRAVRRRRRH